MSCVQLWTGFRRESSAAACSRVSRGWGGGRRGEPCRALRTHFRGSSRGESSHPKRSGRSPPRPARQVVHPSRSKKTHFLFYGLLRRSRRARHSGRSKAEDRRDGGEPPRLAGGLLFFTVGLGCVFAVSNSHNILPRLQPERVPSQNRPGTPNITVDFSPNDR